MQRDTNIGPNCLKQQQQQPPLQWLTKKSEKKRCIDDDDDDDDEDDDDNVEAPPLATVASATDDEDDNDDNKSSSDEDEDDEDEASSDVDDVEVGVKSSNPPGINDSLAFSNKGGEKRSRFKVVIVSRGCNPRSGSNDATVERASKAPSSSQGEEEEKRIECSTTHSKSKRN